MDISAIRNIQSVAVSQAAQQTHVDGDSTFNSIFSTALGMLDETNKLQAMMVLPMVIVALEPIKLSKAPPMGMKRVYIHEPIANDS